MRTLKKTVKAAHVQYSSWKQEVNKMLRNYRATPHSTTGVPPAFFGRSHRVKLPEVSFEKPAVSVESMHDRDALQKSKMKAYADDKRYVHSDIMQPDDSVLVRAKPWSRTPYKSAPLVVSSTKGSLVTA